jgi:hypothetical protein
MGNKPLFYTDPKYLPTNREDVDSIASDKIKEVLITTPSGTGKDGKDGINGIDGHTPIKGVDYFDGLPGAKGDRGDIGLQGPPGERGLQGLAGNDGAQGLPGSNGTQGIPGNDGSPGVKGDKGDQGNPGSTGTPGYTPIKGVDYFDGSPGTPGIKGDTGNTGPAGSDATVTKTAVEAVLTGGITTHTHAYEAANSNIQAHVISAHAPSNAQKNSDITKAEIEAKLTGEISSHTHAGGGANIGEFVINVQALTSSPTDAQTVYFGMLPKAPTTTANISKIYIRKSCTLKHAEIYCYSGTAGTNEAWSLYVRKNNTTDTLIATLNVAASERVFTNAALNVTLVAGDYLEIKGIQPTWGTNPLTCIYGGYLYFE